MAVHRIVLPETLSVASLEALDAALERAADDEGARVWMLVGPSAGTFCRGMDLGAIAEDGGDASVSLRRFATCLLRLRHAHRPTVALVDGEALGGGVGLSAACDVVLATDRSSFALPEALFGLLPGVVMPVLLERMAPQKARLLALAGRSRDAAWAAAHGLVDEVVTADDLGRTAHRYAREMSRVAPRRVKGLRCWIFELLHLDPDAALARGAGVTAELVRDRAVRDAVRTFLEDGTPPWVGR